MLYCAGAISHYMSGIAGSKFLFFQKLFLFSFSNITNPLSFLFPSSSLFLFYFNIIIRINKWQLFTQHLIHFFIEKKNTYKKLKKCLIFATIQQNWTIMCIIEIRKMNEYLKLKFSLQILINLVIDN